MIGRLNISRFIKHGIVGGIGVGINFIIFNSIRHFNLWLGWIGGIGVAFISNYVLNELWTFNRSESKRNVKGVGEN